MNTTTINEKKHNMEAFLSELKKREEQEMLAKRYKESPKYKYAVIDNARTAGLENCAAGVVCKIYRDALPVDETYKNGFQKELDDGFIETIKKESPNGVYTFLSSCAKKGSKPAELMVEAVRAAVDEKCAKFYEELDEIDPDEIDLGPDSEPIQDAIEQVNAKMDYDQISEIIEKNVQNTVRREIETQKAEDAKVKALEEQLSADDSIQTESAIETALMRAGMSKHQYQPTLFAGIMIGKVKEYTEAGDLDTEHVQKKAFFESVKEYTKHEMFSVLNMTHYTQSQLDNLANRYASGMN